MKNLPVVAAVAALLAVASLGCKKKEPAGAGSGTATATDPGSGAGSATGTAAGGAPPSQSAAGAFAAAFDPVNSKLDHVSRARTACEQRSVWLEMIAAMDKSIAGVDALHKAIDEMGDPCDEGNIKAIEAKLDEAKKVLDTIPK